MGDSRAPDKKITRETLWAVHRILPFFILFFLVVPCFSENITTQEGTESILSVATWGTDQASPALWEDLVVWTTLFPDPDDPALYYSDIVLYNISSGIESRIQDIREYSDIPDIWEDRVVYQFWEEGSSEIYLFNVTTSEYLRLTNDTVNQIKPKIE